MTPRNLLHDAILFSISFLVSYKFMEVFIQRHRYFEQAQQKEQQIATPLDYATIAPPPQPIQRRSEHHPYSEDT